MLVKGLKVVEILDVQGRGARAGIKQGDVLIKANKLQLESVEDLTGFMANHTDKKYCTIFLVTTEEEFKLTEVEVGTLGLSLAPVEIVENFNSHLYDALEQRRKEAEQFKIINRLLASTTPKLKGYKIVEHIDLVTTAIERIGKDDSNTVNQALIFNLKKEAYKKGANAIIGVAFNFSSNISNQKDLINGELAGVISTEVTHYASGTAVIVEKIKDS